jgi:hypothetical protein
MARLLVFIMILIALQAGIVLYYNPVQGSTCTTDADCDIAGGSTCVEGACEKTSSTIWTFLINLSRNRSSSDWILLITGFALATLVTGVIAGSLIGVKVTDFIIFAGLVATLLGFVSIFGAFAAIMRDEIISRLGTVDGCTVTVCPAIDILTLLSIGVMGFIYVWTVIDWWRLKD